MSLQSNFNKIMKNPSYALNRLGSKVSQNLEDSYKIITGQQSSSTVVNQKEIRIIGLKRNGNHAVINWIEKQATGFVVHLNDIRVGENPYRCIYNSLAQDHPRNSWMGQQILRYPQYRGKEGFELIEREAKGDFQPKDCLIYSYEDYEISKISSHFSEYKHDFYFGKSAQRYDVLILRDPFNMLASRLKSNKNPVKSWHKTVVDMWIDYAKEYLGETNYLKYNKIAVNYNQWVQDRDYRQQIANKLQLNFSDRGIHNVKTFGGGSSFDGTKFKGKASNMNVFDRWKHFIDNSDYKNMLNNPELFDYSQRIFGSIPGTESLRQ